MVCFFRVWQFGTSVNAHDTETKQRLWWGRGKVGVVVEEGSVRETEGRE